MKRWTTAVLISALGATTALALQSPTEEDAAFKGPEARLVELGLVLPELPLPVVNYVRAVRTPATWSFLPATVPQDPRAATLPASSPRI